MTVVVSLTQMLAEQADGATEVAVAGSTVGEALADLTRRHPGLAALVWRPDGRFNDQLVVFVNQQNVARGEGLAAPLQDGDALMLITAVEGGA